MQRPVATGCNRFLKHFQIEATGNQYFCGPAQPQPVVQSFAVAFGLVAVLFPVHATGP